MRRVFIPLNHYSKNARKPATGYIAISEFKGLDLGHTALTVDKSRSPDAINMIRDEIGQVRKRMGYHTIQSYDGRINGAYDFEDMLIHAGTGLYQGTNKIGEMADNRSQGWRLDGKLYLIDGEALRIVEKSGDAYTMKRADSDGHVPVVIISRNPEGGGTTYEPYNLIQPKFTNSFYGKASVKAYQLTDDNLDEAAVTAQVLNSSGEWVDKVENTDFTVNRTTGVVTFTTAPGVSPVTGEDNIKITAAKTREGYADRINKCTVSTLYGVNGAADRLFLSGNPDYPNRDWYSDQNDPTMFGDLSYSVLGQDSSAVVGYSIVANRLAAHKDTSEDGRNVILRAGELNDGKAQFPIVGTLMGEGAVAPFTHDFLGKEPLFLTSRGIYAITAEDVTGEKYSQSRSSYLNAVLTKEENLSEAVSVTYHDFYLLFLNGRVYVLDGLQRTYSRGQPYSTHQYEGYLLDNIPARVAWAQDGKLYFGTADGKVNEFYTDKESPASYNDNGETIKAHWDTPYFSGGVRHDRKYFKYLSTTLAPAPVTGVTVYGKMNGAMKKLFEDETSARYFTFDYIDFSKLTFSTDTSPRNIRKKISLRYADAVQFRLENTELNEPFGIYDLTIEYEETGKF